MNRKKCPLGVKKYYWCASRDPLPNKTLRNGTSYLIEQKEAKIKKKTHC